MVSQWEKPEPRESGFETVIMDGLEVNEKLGQWFKTTKGLAALGEKDLSFNNSKTSSAQKDELFFDSIGPMQNPLSQMSLEDPSKHGALALIAQG